MESIIFQASDLARDRTRFLDAARSGRALVRDKDGTGLVMLPESDLAILEGFASWSQVHNRLVHLLASRRELTVGELGDLAWLRVFSPEDVRDFVDELHSTLIAALADRRIEVLDEMVRDWRVTARQLEDPLRRSVLLGHANLDELVEVEAPAT